MTDLHVGDDVHDISDRVTPVTAESPLLPGAALSGFTNGKSFFFTDAQIDDVAQRVTGGRLRRRAGGGWEEVVPGRGLRFLAERHINGAIYYRLRKYWEFTAIAG
jgi:hypothetical protein